MKKKIIIVVICIILLIALAIILIVNQNSSLDNRENNANSDNESAGTVQNSSRVEDDFQIDLVYNIDGKDIHYSAYIPENINELDSVNLFITLPGWEGLYFQGVGVNLEYEDFAFTARDINPNMIILAPQLDDWQEQSALDTVALTKYYQENYNIDKTYIEGYSGGGETLSLVLDNNADLYDGALMVSSQWDGGYENVVNFRLPLYFFIGEDDDYYGSGNFKETYQKLHDLYIDEGLSDDEIDNILVLDVRDADYFEERGFSSQHAGGGNVTHEEDIMRWLLTK